MLLHQQNVIHLPSQTEQSFIQPIKKQIHHQSRQHAVASIASDVQAIFFSERFFLSSRFLSILLMNATQQLWLLLLLMWLILNRCQFFELPSGAVKSVNSTKKNVENLHCYFYAYVTFPQLLIHSSGNFF